MYYSTSRVLAVLDLLQAHSRMRGEELAERLEVDARTIRRYVMILRDRGIPVEMKRGRYGGYALPSGYKIPLALTKQEALALTYGLLSGGREHAGLAASDSERALKKVARALPQSTRDLIQNLEEAVTFAAPLGTGDSHSTPEHLEDVVHAIRSHARMHIRYRAWTGDVTERTVDPYQVVNRFGCWYLVGHCHLRACRRVFRLDHLLDARVLPETFLPAPIDALAVVERAIAQTPWRWEYRILVDLPLSQIRRHISSSMATLEQREDGVIVHGFAEDLDWLAYTLVGLRCRLTILHPPELRAHLLTLADHIRSIVEQPGTWAKS